MSEYTYTVNRLKALLTDPDVRFIKTDQERILRALEQAEKDNVTTVTLDRPYVTYVVPDDPLPLED